MDAELAAERFAAGGTLIFIDAPPRMQFGIDLYQWTVGDRFMGLKMIPPGFHIVSYSCESAAAAGHNQSICLDVKPRSLFVYRWLAIIEDVEEVRDEQELDRFRSHLRQLEPQLGAYPQTSTDEQRKFTQWRHLTAFIGERVLQRALPDRGHLTSMTASNLPEPSGISSLMEAVDRPESRTIHFTPVPLKQSYPPGATGQERSKYSQDKSWLLSSLLSGPLSADELLGEMQLAFLLLLVAHNFEGLEQWKLLVQLVCFSREFTMQYSGDNLVEKFVKVMRYQLQEIPRDFFEDFLSRGNFLWHSLMHLYATVYYHSLGDRQNRQEQQLKSAMGKLNEFINRNFQWDVIAECVERERCLDAGGEGGEKEDGPVVVDIDEQEI